MNDQSNFWGAVGSSVGSWYGSMYGWFKLSAAVILRSGSIVRVLLRKSIAVEI